MMKFTAFLWGLWFEHPRDAGNRACRIADLLPAEDHKKPIALLA